MGAKNLLVLKTHLCSFNISFVNDFVCGNMLWAFGSLRVFICNCVLYLFGLILRYISRFLQQGDAKNELAIQPFQTDSEANWFSEELASFLFWSDDVYEGDRERERERETESSVFMEDDEKKRDGETERSVFMEANSDIDEDSEETEVNTESSVLKGVESDVHEDIVKRRTEEDESDFIGIGSAIHEDDKKNGEESGGFMFMEIDSEPRQCVKQLDDDQTENRILLENVTGVHVDSTKREEEKEEVETIGADSVDTASNVQDESEKLDEDKTEESVLMCSGSILHEDAEKIDENEADTSAVMESGPNINDISKKTEQEDREEEEEEEEAEAPVFVETEFATSTNKCQYMSGKESISGFMEEPTAMSFSFREFYMGPHVSSVSNNALTKAKIIDHQKFSELDSEDSVNQEETEDSVSVSQEQVSMPSTPDMPFRFESEAFGGTDSSDEEDFLFNENNSLESDSESESSCSSGLIWGNSNNNNNTVDDSIAYRFLGGKGAAGEGFESEILKLITKDERTGEAEEERLSCDEYTEMEPGKKDLKSFNQRGFGGGVDCAEALDKDKKGVKLEDKSWRNGMKNFEEARWEEGLSDSDSDEQEDEDSFEWEHDDLVEQLKLELRNARQGGLATIFEEEEEEDRDGEEEEEEEEKVVEEEVIESPKVVEEIESLKMEEKLEYKDQVDEIEKIYKSYAEKMKKLDILNYQTMHALGLIQLKDPLKLISIPKCTTLGAKPVISQNLWPRKTSKSTIDPIEKFVHELHRDLELVYVGQVCLSWEILCWQHEKARELERHDSKEPRRRYNLVAGEFQLFQVLLQRFIENEPFQGPRVQNYVKNRCVIRNLLQVPAIKDDSMKDANKGDEEDPIASGRLADMIKESMRVYWEFVRADKDYGNMILKVSQQVGTDLKDPAISGLLEDIRTQLHKKEKRLKDIVRSGNCIVKKFQKHHEDQLDHEQLVAQVGLRLISRVLNTSKLRREQVIWCNEKLKRIKFLSRKIVQVEPSFMLFPC